MKILITGGAGFMGSNFIYYIIRNYPSYKIVCLDSLTYAGNINTLNKALRNSSFEFVKGDITDRSLVFNLFAKERFDTVINFAAESHVDRSITDSDVFVKTNVLGTHVLLEASLYFKVRRYHQVSTDEVYGDLPLNNFNSLFTEKSPIQCSSPYSATKASADLLTLSYHRTYNMPVTISRSTNNYGPYQFPEKLIPLMVSRALIELPLPVYGSGKNIRDWLYVDDHSKAIDLIMKNGKPGEVYNISSYNEKANIEVVQTILNELGKSRDLITFVEDRLGHDLRYAVDSSKIRTELGWKPTFDFADGIKKTIQWYVNNKDWLENISNGNYMNYGQAAIAKE